MLKVKKALILGVAFAGVAGVAFAAMPDSTPATTQSIEQLPSIMPVKATVQSSTNNKADKKKSPMALCPPFCCPPAC